MSKMFVAQMRLIDDRHVEVMADDRALLDLLIEAVKAQGMRECTVLQMEQVVTPPTENDECECDACVERRGLQAGPRTH